MTEPEPTGTPLPHTWRPRRTRKFCRALSAVLLVVFGSVAALLPGGGGFSFSFLDRVGVFAFAAGIAWFLNRHASVLVRATTEGLEVVNLFHTRRFSWGEVLAVRLRPGDPWAFIDIADGETVALMGIQASDGPAATAAARELARLARRLTPGQPQG
ncbi:MAG TPA: PH domain-containing protein [Sporichthyaceae bacterium]|nr:PH domain-containing protein [Sporichthyaceae bacterium]